MHTSTLTLLRLSEKSYYSNKINNNKNNIK